MGNDAVTTLRDAIIGAVPVIALCASAPLLIEESLRKWRRSIIAIGLPIVLFCWLRAPWVALGVVKVWRMNINAVNQHARPDEVQPVPGQVYRADQKPVE